MFCKVGNLIFQNEAVVQTADFTMGIEIEMDRIEEGVKEGILTSDYEFHGPEYTEILDELEDRVLNPALPPQCATAELCPRRFIGSICFATGQTLPGCGSWKPAPIPWLRRWQDLYDCRIKTSIG